MANPLTNPLNAFVSIDFTDNFRAPRPPKLGPLIKEHGFSKGIEAFDEQMDRFKLELDRTVNDRLQPKSPPGPSKIISTAKTVATNAATATPPSVTPPEPPPPAGSELTVGGEPLTVGGEEITL